MQTLIWLKYERIAPWEIETIFLAFAFNSTGQDHACQGLILTNVVWTVGKHQ